MKILLQLVLILIVNTVYSQKIMVLKDSGKVVIGDIGQISTPDGYSLFVQDGILTEKVKVAIKETGDWSDDSFDKLPELNKIEHSIKTKNHLLNIPSAEELVKNGYSVTEMDAKLLEQIEWIWLYVLKLEKENSNLKKELMEFKSQIPKVDKKL